jgi:hypothetical protein
VNFITELVADTTLAIMASGGGLPQDGGDNAHVRARGAAFTRELSVKVDVLDNTKVKAMDIIKAVTEVAGVGSLLACIPKSGNVYEITLADKESVQIVSPGLSVGDHTFKCMEVVLDELVVSFLHLPAYVSDEQITNKLNELGVEILGSIKRRVYPNTEIADGTRHVKVRFPPQIKSLPYSMKFFDGEANAYYRVIHNKQVKVCNNCMAENHVFRECPENRCFKCSDYGHLSRNCKAERCEMCRKFGGRCVCIPSTSFNVHRCTICGMFDCDCQATAGALSGASEDGWHEGENMYDDGSSVNSEDALAYVLDDERGDVGEGGQMIVHEDSTDDREDADRVVTHSGGESRVDEDRTVENEDNINFKVIRDKSVICVDNKNKESVVDTGAGATGSNSISVDVEPSTMDWNVVPGKSRRRKRLDIKPNVDAPRISVKKLKTNVNANTKT